MGYFALALAVVSLALSALYLVSGGMWQSLPRWLWSTAGGTTNKDLPQPAEADSKSAFENSKGEDLDSISNGHSDGDSTPKAGCTEPSIAVPTFSLDQDSDADSKGSMAPSATPDVPREQGTKQPGSMLPPPKPSPDRASSLMPPPSRPASTQRNPPPSAASSLRVPSTGPLPNRGPPANSQQRASGGLTPNGGRSSGKARNKVLLSPGHSPMDWAALTRKGNLSGMATLQRVTPSQLRTMTGRKGKPAWSAWQGKVYNLTPYVPFHPGGEAEILKGAGRDGTQMFMDVHPWVNWENMLGSCLVGVMVPEGTGGEEDEGLEGLD